MDALTLLRAYLAGDETAIMSRAHVEAVIAEIDRLQGHLMHANTSVEVLRSELAAERERTTKLREALEWLVTLKDERDRYGKTPEYEAKKAQAWVSARAVLKETEK
jgi:hypothetical protein